jgi:hypothetical protein
VAVNFRQISRNGFLAVVAAGLGVIAIGVMIFGVPRTPKAQGPEFSTAPQADRIDVNVPSPETPVLIPQAPDAPRPGANAEVASIFPKSQLPVVATADGARFSLSCLAKNGADLTKPMPSKHHIFAANEQIASRLQAWAQENGFEIRNKLVLAGHTGKPEIQFDLVRVEVPDPEKVEREGKLILSEVQQIPGSFYQTWSGEIIR